MPAHRDGVERIEDLPTAWELGIEKIPLPPARKGEPPRIRFVRIHFFDELEVHEPDDAHK